MSLNTWDTSSCCSCLDTWYTWHIVQTWWSEFPGVDSLKMASTDWITGIVMIKYGQNFHHPMYHCVPICDKKCFMILTMTLRVMREGGLVLHFLFNFSTTRNESSHHIMLSAAWIETLVKFASSHLFTVGVKIRYLVFTKTRPNDRH